jgi:hypothetical protein
MRKFRVLSSRYLVRARDIRPFVMKFFCVVLKFKEQRRCHRLQYDYTRRCCVLYCSMLAWDNACVWYASNLESAWKPGVVKSYQLLQGGDYIFSILCHDDQIMVTVESRPLDNSCLEFNLVKKREKDSTKSIGVKDMTSLSFLNEPEMIDCLRLRYSERFIYTSIGPILVAVNPFEMLSSEVYSTKTIEKYFKADQTQLKTLGPHVFQISNNAYHRMFLNQFVDDKRENQSILVNGESGAGILTLIPLIFLNFFFTFYRKD